MTSYLAGRETVTSATTNIVRTGAGPTGSLPVLGAAPATSGASPQTPGAAMQPFSAHRHTEAHIETVVVDGIVQKIIVLCGCGERIEIHCGY